MNVSVPAVAPPTPPDTGASMYVIPCSLPFLFNCLAIIGEMVLESMITEPFFPFLKIPESIYIFTFVGFTNLNGVWSVGNHQNIVIDFISHIFKTSFNLDLLLSGDFDLLSIRIKAINLMTFFNQVGCHRQSHISKTDHPYPSKRKCMFEG